MFVFMSFVFLGISWLCHTRSIFKKQICLKLFSSLVDFFMPFPQIWICLNAFLPLTDITIFIPLKKESVGIKWEKHGFFFCFDTKDRMIYALNNVRTIQKPRFKDSYRILALMSVPLVGSLYGLVPLLDKYVQSDGTGLFSNNQSFCP